MADINNFRQLDFQETGEPTDSDRVLVVKVENDKAVGAKNYDLSRLRRHILADVVAYVEECRSIEASVSDTAETVNNIATQSAALLETVSGEFDELKGDLSQLSGEIEDLYGCKYALYEGVLHKDTGDQAIISLTGLAINNFKIIIDESDFTGGALTTYIAYSDGTSYNDTFNASRNGRVYSAKEGTTISTIKIHSITSYLSGDTYAKGKLIFDYEDEKWLPSKIENIKNELNNCADISENFVGYVNTIDSLNGGRIIRFEGSVSQGTGEATIINLQNLSEDNICVFLDEYDFTGGYLTLYIGYSDGTSTSISFQPNKDGKIYNAPTDGKITNIKLYTNRVYLKCTTTVKGRFVLNYISSSDFVNDTKKTFSKCTEKTMSHPILPLGINLSDSQVVLEQGESGSFDAGKIESPFVWWDSNELKYGMLYTGYGYENGGYTHGEIGIAWSTDLITWEKESDSLLKPSSVEGSADFGGVTGPVLLIKDNTYYLYYIGCSGSGYEGGVKTLCLATGSDLHSLVRYRNNPLISPAGTGSGTPYDYEIYHANIVTTNEYNYMFMNCRGVSPTDKVARENILLFKSKDLKQWFYDSVVVEGGTDEDAPDYQICGDPCVYDIGDDFYYMTTFRSTKGWVSTSTGLVKTSKEAFPKGWVKTDITINNDSGYSKAFVFYKGSKLYMFTSNSNIKLQTEE